MVRHVLHAPLTCRHQLGYGTQVLFGHINNHVFHWFVQFAVDGFGDYLRFTHGQFEAFAAHLLHQNSEGELAAALNFPSIRALGGQNLDGDVTDKLAVKTVLDLACGHLRTFDAARHRRGVNADGHGDRRVVHLNKRQRLGVFGIGQGFTNGNVFDTGDRHDFAGACFFGGNTFERLGCQQLGDTHVLNIAVLTCPSDGLPFLEGAVEDTHERQTTQERRRVEVGHVRLQHLIRVVGGGGHVLDNGLKQRFQIVIIGQGTVGRLVQRCGASLAGGVDDRHIEHTVEVKVGYLLGQVRCQAEQQIHSFADDLVDARIRAVHLVHHQNDGQLRDECLAQHEAGLRQRAFGCVHEQHHAIDHRKAAFDFAAEVGVPGGINHVNGDGFTVRGGAIVEHGGVLREDGNAFFLFKVAGVHHAVFDVCVRRERVGLLEHRIHDGGFAVVNVCHDRHVAQIRARSGVFRHA